MAGNISPVDFLSTTSSNLLLLCKDLRELEPNYIPNEVIDGSFKITSFFNNSKTWYNCGFNIALPEIISRYLHLNLTFVTPNNDFDGTMGYINGTHASGPLKMIANNQVDNVKNNIFLAKSLWHCGMIAISSAVDQSYAISFAMIKKTITLYIVNI